MTPFILVVAESREDPFSALFFQTLPPDVRCRIRIGEFGNDSLTANLADASAVILMRRGLFDFGNLRAWAGLLKVPRYYFLDDNFILVREEPKNFGADWAEYTHERVRAALAGFEGVLLATRPLVEYFREHALHSHLMEYPPIAGPILCRRDSDRVRGADEPFRIAFFGGNLRRSVFARFVYPAIRRLARERRVELIVAGIDPGALAPDENFRIVYLPYDVRYRAALRQLATHRIDVLVHPTPPTRINPYKNANVLINARAIGAVPVLSNVAPYATLGPPPPAILVGDDTAAWHDALARVAADRAYGDEIFAAVERHCDVHFAGAQNVQAIRDILAAHPGPSLAMRAVRRGLATVPLAFDRGLARAMNAARRSTVLRRAVASWRARTPTTGTG
jgi:hypothetical protein